ncbi:MAG: tetratricopeptide repeat protein [Verrucomicrobia bacterium]|nr:tetratricopeptide repeat protein [Verrucomicrobiota bacterium]
MTRLEKPRLNAAHFLLASLLGVQPGRFRPSKLFKARSAFSRLILTTNFDPFLQTALQAVNRLYFMSDTPELGVGDEILDDPTDAVHLVYLHGSVHRRSQAASDQDIQTLKEKNAQRLEPVLKRHGVIVLGYSGWDDAVVEALAVCDRFDHRLYWCGLEPDPLAPGAFGPRVPEILRKPAALYVQIAGAGRFMAQLCSELVRGLPRLLDNPIGQLRELLDTIDLKELEELKTQSSAGSKAPQLSPSETSTALFVEAKRVVLERLEQAEQAFFGPAFTAPALNGGADQALAQSPLAMQVPGESPAAQSQRRSRIEQLLSSAQVAGRLGNYSESIRIADEALALPQLDPSERGELLLVRALGHYFLGQSETAISDWSKVAELPGAPVQQMAQALVNRGLAWGLKGDTDKALTDFTRVIEQLPGAPTGRVAQALFNRGVAWGKKGDTNKALSDYTQVIEQMPGASVEQVALALVNRGLTWGKMGDTDKALADYTQVIEQMSGTPVEQVAQALVNRGWAHYLMKRHAAFLADTQAAVDKQPALDSAAFNLGLAFLACGRDADALDAYREAGTRFPEAIETLGLPDLHEARKTWLAEERATPVIQLLQLLQVES